MTVREWQKKEGLTNLEAAKFLGVSERTIQNWDKKGESKLVKMYIELTELYVGALRKNKSFRIQRIGNGRVAIMVWGEKSCRGQYDWKVWRTIPIKQAKRMGLVYDPSNRGKKKRLTIAQEAVFIN